MVIGGNKYILYVSIPQDLMGGSMSFPLEEDPSGLDNVSFILDFGCVNI